MVRNFVTLPSHQAIKKQAYLALSTSILWKDENPTSFAFTFDFDNNIITGFFESSYIRIEEERAYDAAEISANILNGTVIWD